LVLFFHFESPAQCLKQDFLSLNNTCSHQLNQNLFFNQKENYLVTDSLAEQIVFQQNSFKQTASTTIYEGRVLASLSFDLEPRKEIIDYLVQKGDTLSNVAEKFGLSLNTILWANDLSASSPVLTGQKLVILPVDGLTHLVSKGETLSQLAQYYQADSFDIIDINEISDEGEIFSGDLLIIPGGKKPTRLPTTYNAPLASSYFICPIPSPCTISQGLHWYNAIDFSHGKCGEPVFASAGGVVQRTGYHNTAGNYVRILHPNGVVTFYGHLSKILAVAGQQVSQGAIIGYIGNTGHTIGATGCHVHFEVRGARNPFAY